MPTENQRRVSRRAIYSSLVFWLAVQLTQLLKPLGVPPFVSTSLFYAALVSFPAFVLWPWLKDLLPPGGEEEVVHPDQDRFMDAMVNFEIVALCAMLLFLCFAV